jgi:hypothetical protein
MALVFAKNAEELTVFPVAHDPEEEKYYPFVWQPYIWEPNKIYYLDDVVIPESFTGFYYLCVDPGISGNTSPSFPTENRKTVKDNTVLWKSFPYIFQLRYGDEIITTSPKEPTFKVFNLDGTVNNDIIIDGEDTDGYRTWCLIKNVPEALEGFILTNEVYIQLSSGGIEKYNRSIQVMVKTL